MEGKIVNLLQTQESGVVRCFQTIAKILKLFLKKIIKKKFINFKKFWLGLIQFCHSIVVIKNFVCYFIILYFFIFIFFEENNSIYESSLNPFFHNLFY